MDQVIPAVVLCAANVLSGRHGSLRWETVTAVFGWIGAFGLAVGIILKLAAPQSSVTSYVWQVGAFCLLTAISRDYEKILRPLFSWNR